MYCSKTPFCDGPVKPEMTFFGEAIPVKFKMASNDLADTDLLIVIGTSLAVAPFNQCINKVPEKCPKVLINLHNTDTNGFDFADKENHPERLLLKGKSQDTVMKIADACGWKDELIARKEKADAEHDLKMQ